MLIRRLTLLSVIAFPLLVSCSTVGFLSQAGRGQFEILTKTRPAENVIADPATPERLRERLQLAAEIRTYAKERLGLTVERQYAGYADLERDAAIYSVVVAEPFELKTRDFCFPIAGCVPYRGYFNEQGAEREAAVWRRRGFDVTVGKVDAFSTLGYFPDPLLNTFVTDGELGLAELLFHELLHATFYLPGDVAFNESLATAFEVIAVDRWIADTGRAYLLEERARRDAAKAMFNRLMERTSTRLRALYAQPIADHLKARKKAEILRLGQAEYLQVKPQIAPVSFDSFFLSDDFNNAKVMAVGVYDKNVDAFLKLYALSGRDLERFMENVRTLARRDRAARNLYLNQLNAS